MIMMIFFNPTISLISFHIISKRLFLKREGLSDIRVVSITKSNVFFNKIHKIFKPISDE